MSIWIKNLIFSLLLLSLISGCQKRHQDETRIAISPWIGYTPIYYAEEKGWLKDIGIKIIHTTSLHETVHYYQAGLIDAFVSTQYEASLLKDYDLTHFMPLDRSNGGDIILSNRSLSTIKNSKKIKSYFEIDSVNQIVFNDFMNKYQLNNLYVEIQNRPQTMMKDLNPVQNEDIIIVTYEPYATFLKNKGFKEIASTKDSDIVVIDSLYFRNNHLLLQKEKSKLLINSIKKAYKVLNDNPKEFYNVVKFYLEGVSYSEFNNTLLGIEWLINTSKEEFNSFYKKHDDIPKVEDI